MGSFVLYVMMQAMCSLVFAYLLGALAFKERRLHLALVAMGLYLIMGSALIEVGAERGGWTATWLGIYIALVSIGVVAMGTGCILREGDHWDIPRRLELVIWGLLVAAIAMGGLLVATAGTSSAVVDPKEIIDADISGSFRHLGPAGWALGAPLFVGAVMIIIAGARTSIGRGDGRGLWLWGAGILYIIWPFDVFLGDLTLSPTILLMAIATTYFGFQPQDRGEEHDGGKEEGPQDRASSPDVPEEEDPPQGPPDEPDAEVSEGTVGPGDGNGPMDG